MKSLMLNLDDFKSSTHKAHQVYIDELIDPNLLETIKEYNNNFLDLDEDQLREMNLIQSKILSQLGLFDGNEEKMHMVVLVPIDEEPVPGTRPVVRSPRKQKKSMWG